MAGVNIIQAPKTRGEYWQEALGKAASNFMTGYTKRMEGQQLAEGLDFNQPSGYYQLGQRFLEMGDYDRALKSWERGQDLEAALAKAAGGSRDYNLQPMRTEAGVEYWADPRKPGIYYDAQGNQIMKPEGRSVKVGTGAEEGTVATKAEATEIRKVVADFGKALNIDIERDNLLIDRIQTEMRRTGKSATSVLEDLYRGGELTSKGDWLDWGAENYMYQPSVGGTPPIQEQTPAAPSGFDAYRSRGK